MFSALCRAWHGMCSEVLCRGRNYQPTKRKVKTMQKIITTVIAVVQAFYPVMGPSSRAPLMLVPSDVYTYGM